MKWTISFMVREAFSSSVLVTIRIWVPSPGRTPVEIKAGWMKTRSSGSSRIPPFLGNP